MYYLRYQLTIRRRTKILKMWVTTIIVVGNKNKLLHE